MLDNRNLTVRKWREKRPGDGAWVLAEAYWKTSSPLTEELENLTQTLSW